MSSGKVYKIRRIEDEWPEPTWGREPLEGEDSYYIVFVNDAGEEVVLRLCMDDESINFLTARHLEQI